MRNTILFLALLTGFLAGCQTAPMDEAAYADTVNADKRVWPPYVPGQAVPAQVMDGGRR